MKLIEVPIDEGFSIENIAIVLMNLDRDDIEEYDETIWALTAMVLYSYDLKKLDLNLKYKTTYPSNCPIKEPLMLEL